MISNKLSNSKILVVAPHPDDESIGCGGLISTFPKNCDVLLLTDGSKGISDRWSKDTIVEQRKKEFLRAMETLGVSGFKMLNIEDKKVKKSFPVIKRTVNLRAYDYVFLPNRHERHTDHKYAYKLLKKLALLQRAKCVIVEYEVWTPLRDVNVVLDISPVFAKKLSAIRLFESQLDVYDYVGMATGLNTYRGSCAKKEYAEAYYVNVKHAFLKKVYHRLRYGDM